MLIITKPLKYLILEVLLLYLYIRKALLLTLTSSSVILSVSEGS